MKFSQKTWSNVHDSFLNFPPKLQRAGKPTPDLSSKAAEHPKLGPESRQKKLWVEVQFAELNTRISSEPQMTERSLSLTHVSSSQSQWNCKSAIIVSLNCRQGRTRRRGNLNYRTQAGRTGQSNGNQIVCYFSKLLYWLRIKFCLWMHLVLCVF